MGQCRQCHGNDISRSYHAPCPDDPHDASLADQTTLFITVQHCRQKPVPKVIDLATRIAQTGHLDDSFVAQMQQRAARQRQQIKPPRGQILADFSRRDDESLSGKFGEEFAVKEVDLPQVGLRWVDGDAREMPHCHPAVRVTFDSKSPDQPDFRFWRLAEIMRMACADGCNMAIHLITLASYRFGVSAVLKKEKQACFWIACSLGSNLAPA